MRENLVFKTREYKVITPDEIYIFEGRRWVEISFIEIGGLARVGAERWKARVVGINGIPVWIFKSDLLEANERWKAKMKLWLAKKKSKATEAAHAKRLKTRKKYEERNVPISQKALMCAQTCKHDCVSSRNLNTTKLGTSGYKGVRREAVTGKFSVIAMGVFIASYDCVLRANKVKLEVDEYILENSSVEVSEVQNAFRYMRKIEKMEQKSEGSEGSEESEE